MEEAGESTRPACSLPAETGAHAASRTAPLESATRDDSFGSGPSFREDGESDAASRHNEEGNVCRYCLECEPWEELIRPCLCTAPVHKSCLSRWIRSGDSQTNRELECELCRAPFRAKLVPAPFSALLFTGEGRRILATTTLRALYRVFLIRRLTQRWRHLASRWWLLAASKASSQAGIGRVLSLFRDTALGALLAALLLQMTTRDWQTLYRSVVKFRDNNGTLSFEEFKAPPPGGGSAASEDLSPALPPQSWLLWPRPGTAAGGSLFHAAWFMQGARVLIPGVHLRIQLSL